MRKIQLAEISEKVFNKFGVEAGLVLICSHTAAELYKMI